MSEHGPLAVAILSRTHAPICFVYASKQMPHPPIRPALARPWELFDLRFTPPSLPGDRHLAGRGALSALTTRGFVDTGDSPSAGGALGGRRVPAHQAAGGAGRDRRQQRPVRTGGGGGAPRSFTADSCTVLFPRPPKTAGCDVPGGVEIALPTV